MNYELTILLIPSGFVILLTIMIRWLEQFREDIRDWGRGWFFYLERKLRRFGIGFETQKSRLVEVLMARRGTFQRPFLHASVVFLIVAGGLSAPIVANSYPGGIPNDLGNFTPPSAVLTSLDFSEYGVQTERSQKPRDQVEIYPVVVGDTLSTIADKFGVSVDTLKWENDIKSDSLSIGQKIRIPPVTGIVHKVNEGETIYSISKKYKTDPQKIVNFPFNDFADLDTFALSAGQTLIVPDGVQPQAPPLIARAPALVSGSAGGTGQFQWPTSGIITQYPVWYHLALDVANSAAPGIQAAEGGTVASVEYLQYGYGRHAIIDHGNGLSTLYGHLSEIYIKAGDRVSRGQVIGRMGSTGRSTGTHLHFEVRKGGAIVNPLPFLK